LEFVDESSGKRKEEKRRRGRRTNDRKILIIVNFTKVHRANCIVPGEITYLPRPKVWAVIHPYDTLCVPSHIPGSNRE
jgi:hypothetical protein